MKTSYSVTGAAINFHLAGNPADVATYVARLFNYGVITNVPDTFREGRDETVTVQSDKGRTMRGFAGIAQTAILANPATPRRYWKNKGLGLLNAASERRAAEMFAALPRESATPSLRDEGFSDFIPAVDEDELSPELKAAGRRMLAALYLDRNRGAASRRMAAESEG